MSDAPPRDELVAWLHAHPYTEVYTGQGSDGPGEGGIKADMGGTRTPDDVIFLWDAINRCRLPLEGVVIVIAIVMVQRNTVQCVRRACLSRGVSPDVLPTPACYSTAGSAVQQCSTG